MFTGRKVKEGAIIAIGGNNGKSTGPHLHFALDKRTKGINGWSDWKRINPMPLFRHKECIVHCTYHHDQVLPDVDHSLWGTGPYQGTWFYEGVQKSASEAKSIIKKL